MKKALYISTLALIATYLVGVSIFYYSNRSKMLCRGVEIQIADSAQLRFITPAIARQWIDQFTGGVVAKPLTEIDINAIENHLTTQEYTSQANIFTTIDGTIHIQINQRKPLLRVLTENGYNFYVDSLAHILQPVKHFSYPTSIISGLIEFDFDKKYFGQIEKNDKEFIKKLTNFVQFIEKDDFLKNLITQIYVTPDCDIELVPRIGIQIIRMGKVEDYQQKLLRLKLFYQQSFTQGWWEKAKFINLKYKNQVIIQ